MKKAKKKTVKSSNKQNPASLKAKAGSVLSELQGIYSFMKDNDLETFAYARGDLRVKIARRGAQTVPVPVPVPSGYAAAPGAAPAGNGAAAAPAAAPVQAGKPIKAPLMGIFYRAPTPSSPPFCKEGDIVTPGQTIGLVEAMKVFNEIKAEFKCKVLKVVLDNGRPVKAGQDLFYVEKA